MSGFCPINGSDADCHAESADPTRQPGSPGIGFSEAAVWRSVSSGWRRVHGGFAREGLSIEWHSFADAAELDWAASVHPQSVEIVLNLSGDGTLRARGGEARFSAATWGFYCRGGTPLQGSRCGGAGRHQFLTIEVGLPFLREALPCATAQLHPLIAGALRDGRFTTGLGTVLTLTAEHERLITRLQSPPVFQAVEPLWYRSRVLELMAGCFFLPPAEEELFCDRQKRLARERTERAIELLRQSLATPPGLEELGRKVGCSPFYLSRTFSRELGMTIPQYVRRLRMERAAELLETGRFNVTEVALEVGYNSLSHFSQAFCQVLGVCPALYQRRPPEPGGTG